MTAPNTPDTPATPGAVRHVPLAEIDPEALPRDRTCLASADMDELVNSITLAGVRMPVELFPLEAPRTPQPPADAAPDAAPLRWGLLSGYRRYHAVSRLHADELALALAEQPFATIPAFIRPRAALAEQLVAVVEENAIRSDLSPWEQGHVACHAWRRGVFGTIDEAVAKLYRSSERTRRVRLRAIAQVVEELDCILTQPELLNQRQLLRLSRAIDAGFGDVIRYTLESAARTTPEAQWELILPYLIEAEEPAKDAPPPRPGRPRRLAAIRDGLMIRRVRTPEGYALHFSGEEATSDLVCHIIDEIERMYGR